MGTISRDAFDDYVKLRFENRKSDYKQLAADKKNFYCRRVEELLECVGFRVTTDPNLPADEGEKAFETDLAESGIQIVTIRTAFDKGSPLLKPVATFPAERLSDAEDFAQNQKPQPFRNATEALKWTNYCEITEDSTSSKVIERFSGIYKLGSIPKGTTKNEKLPTIAFRIEDAIKNSRKVSDAFIDDSVCLFSVITSPTNDGRHQIDKIVAIYWKQSLQHVLPDGALKHVHELCGVLFNEIPQIQMIDNQLFQLEGHELVSSLQPTFLNSAVAPADKIAFAIAKLKSLLQKHLDSHYPATEKSRVNPDVYFVSISYETVSDEQQTERTYKPRFQVYPHVFRKTYALPAYYISRPDQISVTKLLLKKYFDWHKISREGGKLSREFVLGPSALLNGHAKLALIDTSFTNDLFKDFERQAKGIRKKRSLTIDFDECNGDQIFVSKAKDAPPQVAKLYSQLNVAVKGNKHENSSIIAYVIEGRGLETHGFGRDGSPAVQGKYRQLPRAILAIEGQREELFSVAERNSLRVVAEAFSNLVRHSFHDNSLLDYRGQLSDAYRKFVSRADPINQSRLSRFLLSSMAVDAQLLKEIMEQLSLLGGELPKNLEFVYKNVFNGTESADEDTLENAINDRLRQRFERALRFAERAAVGGRGDEYVVGEDLVEFIEACPKNFAWAGYSPSLAEALGDRAEHSPPSFRLMTPGFSASGLYMAVVRSEIRQVAKLASLEKLTKEHRNYRNFVRYKLVLAARMAATAVSFDSRGVAGLEQGNSGADTFLPAADYQKYCFGVLVSDLASSRKLGARYEQEIDNQVSTLQDLAWNAVIRIKSAGELVEFQSIAGAIQHLFGNNLGHWFSLADTNALKDGPWKVMARAFRLNYDEKLDFDNQRALDLPQNDFSIINKFYDLLGEDRRSRFFDCVYRLDKEHVPRLEQEDLDKRNHELVTKIEETAAKAVLNSDRLYRFAKMAFEGRLSLPSTGSLAEEFGSVVHGDLNARNLVWAGPIEHLVMIDFEHTMIGLMGVDQARLAVNLVVDHMAPYSARTDDDDFELNEKQLEDQIDAVERAAKFLVTRIVDQKATWERPSTQSGLSEERVAKEPTSILADIVAEVLYSVHDFFKDRNVKSHFGVLANALALALVKEYEYGVKNFVRARLEPKQVLSFFEAKEQSMGSLKNWLLALFKAETFGKSTRSKEQLTSVARYAITFWILHRIFEQVSFEE